MLDLSAVDRLAVDSKCRILLLQTFEQLNLSRVVHVVCGDAGDEEEVRYLRTTQVLVQLSGRHVRDRRSHGLVRFDEQLHVATPSRRGRLLRCDPVRAFDRERTSFLAQNPTADGVLPIRSVHNVLPDVVPLCLRAPHGLTVRHATDRAA